MEHIGTKIKQLRKKNDMTQEKLADYLGVSFQAISKWETGVASPDLALIVPIAKLFHVSTDELLGLNPEKDDPRKKELDELWRKTWESGDIVERYKICKAAVEEFPGDHKLLERLADAEWYYSQESQEPKRTELLESSVRHSETVLEDCDDHDIKELALCSIVISLSTLGRKEEAIPYAKQYHNPSELLGWCLSGDEWQENHQKDLESAFGSFLNELSRTKEKHLLEIAVSTAKALIDDGNFLWYHDTLMHDYVWLAMRYTEEKDFAKAVECLKNSHYHAVEYEKMEKAAKNEGVGYTCKAFNRLKFYPGSVWKSGTSTLPEDFKEYLTCKEFDPMRENEDFKALFEL